MIEPICTFHAEHRRMQRGITQKQIVEAVDFGEVVRRYADRVVYALKRLRVVVSRRQDVIVTVWRERKVCPKRNMRKAKKAEKKMRRQWR